jgi:hypothetical protein
MVFQILLCGECYENVYTSTYRRKKYPSFKVNAFVNVFVTFAIK